MAKDNEVVNLRFEDTPGLFGTETGGGTYRNITCEWCGTKYRHREHPDGEPKDNDNRINFDQIFDKQVCECCFAKIELAVLRDLPRILPWYKRLLQKRLAATQKDLSIVGRINKLSLPK